MRPKSYVFLLFLMSLANACSKNDPPQPETEQQEEGTPDSDPEVEEPVSTTYFTLKSDRPKTQNIIEEWIVIHDDKGLLLDFKKFDVGDNLVFESEKDISDFISITEVRYIQYDFGKKFSITTTTGVEKGSNWTLEPDPEPTDFYDSNGTEGNFNFDVTGIPELKHLNVTNTKFSIAFSPRITSYPGPPPSSDLTVNLALYTGENDYYVSILDGLAHLKYYDFSYAGTDIVVDYDDFKEFDAYHSINLPENNFYVFEVAGFKQDHPYSESFGSVLQQVRSNASPDLPTQPFIYGYLDDFEKYRTLLRVGYKNFQYTRVQYGPRLEQIEIPEPSLTILDSSRFNFRFNVDIEYVSSSHLWSYDEGSIEDNNILIMQWFVESENGFEPFVGELPEVILEQYPEMNIKDLEYKQTLLSLPLENAEYNSRNLIVIKKE